VSELSTVLAINEGNENLPESVVLYQNYPNPFNPNTTIPFQIEKASRVIIEVYNLLGEKINTLIDREFQPGNYRAEWNGLTSQNIKAPSGCYIYRLTSGNKNISKKMILLN